MQYYAELPCKIFFQMDRSIWQNASYKALAHSVALAVIFDTLARLVAYIVRSIEFVIKVGIGTVKVCL
jgi:hypothetical protein